MKAEKCKQKVVSKVTMEAEAGNGKTRFQKDPLHATNYA